MFITFPITQKVKNLTGSKKRKFYLSIRPDNSEINTASYWDGGSRHVYSVLNINTGERKTPPCGSFPIFEAKYILQENEIMIETGVCQGKPSTPVISIRSSESEKVQNYLK